MYALHTGMLKLDFAGMHYVICALRAVCENTELFGDAFKEQQYGGI